MHPSVADTSVPVSRHGELDVKDKSVGTLLNSGSANEECASAPVTPAPERTDLKAAICVWSYTPELAGYISNLKVYPPASPDQAEPLEEYFVLIPGTD